MPRPGRAVDRGLRLADHGACVPWAALAAMERAQADAADRRSLVARDDGSRVARQRWGSARQFIGRVLSVGRIRAR